jgi:hypothetical protein
VQVRAEARPRATRLRSTTLDEGVEHVFD